MTDQKQKIFIDVTTPANVIQGELDRLRQEGADQKEIDRAEKYLEFRKEIEADIDAE